jgi:hypothetical protein
MLGPDWKEANGSWLRIRVNWNLFTGFVIFLVVGAALGLLAASLNVSIGNKNKLQDIDKVVENRMQSWCASKAASLVLQQASAFQAGNFYKYLSFFSPNATVYEHDTMLPHGGAWTGLDSYESRSIYSFFYLMAEYIEFGQISVNERDLHNCGSDTFELEMIIEVTAFCPGNPSIRMQIPYDRSHAIVSKFDWQHKIIRQDLHCDNSAITAFLIQECELSLPLAVSSLHVSNNGNSTNLPWKGHT